MLIDNRGVRTFLKIKTSVYQIRKQKDTLIENQTDPRHFVSQQGYKDTYSCFCYCKNRQSQFTALQSPKQSNKAPAKDTELCCKNSGTMWEVRTHNTGSKISALAASQAKD